MTKSIDKLTFLRELHFVGCLNEDTYAKSATLLFKSTNENTAVPDINDPTFIQQIESQIANGEEYSVLIMSKVPFDQSNYQNITKQISDLRIVQENDIYHRFKVADKEDADIYMQLINPCTILHIKKYLKNDYQMVSETAKDYQEKIVPFIKSLPPSRLAWLHAILEKKAEQDVIIFHDTDPEMGFCLSPDSKWDGQMNSMYLLAICQRRDISCLRDLRASHLPFLKHLNTAIKVKVGEKYPLIKPGHLRLFVHYHPSYYHFHVHVVSVFLTGHGGSVVGQAHLLDDVIYNLEMDSEYYTKRTMTFAISVNQPIYGLLKYE